MLETKCEENAKLVFSLVIVSEFESKASPTGAQFPFTSNLEIWSNNHGIQGIAVAFFAMQEGRDGLLYQRALPREPLLHPP